MKKRILAEFKKSGKPITHYAELLGVTRMTIYNRIKCTKLFSFKDIRLLKKNGVDIERYL